MTEWSHDGSPLQHGTGRHTVAMTNVRAPYSIVGLRECAVVARYYVDDPRNRSKRFVEYVVRDLQTSELYPGARQLSAMGGVNDGDDNTLHPATSLLPGATGPTGSLGVEQSPANTTDGDQVMVGFIEGSRARPVIISVFRQSASAYGATSVDGERRLTVHKKTSIEIKADGTYVITSAGGASITMDQDGQVAIESKSGSTITMNTSGDVIINAAEGAFVQLGDGTVPVTAAMGVVNGLAVDPFTGSTQFALGNASLTVQAKK